MSPRLIFFLKFSWFLTSKIDFESMILALFDEQYFINRFSNFFPLIICWFLVKSQKLRIWKISPGPQNMMLNIRQLTFIIPESFLKPPNYSYFYFACFFLQLIKFGCTLPINYLNDASDRRWVYWSNYVLYYTLHFSSVSRI